MGTGQDDRTLGTQVQPAFAMAGARNSMFGPPAIDCDSHIAVPSVRTILPYLDDYWHQQFMSRGIDRVRQ